MWVKKAVGLSGVWKGDLEFFKDDTKDEHYATIDFQPTPFVDRETVGWADLCKKDQVGWHAEAKLIFTVLQILALPVKTYI